MLSALKSESSLDRLHYLHQSPQNYKSHTYGGYKPQDSPVVGKLQVT